VTDAPIRLPAARRRRQLLDVARDVFADRGFHGTSMDEVATAAGVTKPVLYQHFGSKRALYLELLDDAGSQLIEAIAKATSGALHPRQQVEAGFAAYFGLVHEHEAAFQLLFGGGPKRDDAFAERVHQVEDAIAELIASLIAADLPAGHPLVLAHGIVGMAEAACRRWLQAPPAERLTPDELAAALAELAWAGLRGVGTTRR
jgi:AcrR family transcriptional regulator